VRRESDEKGRGFWSNVEMKQGKNKISEWVRKAERNKDRDRGKEGLGDKKVPIKLILPDGGLDKGPPHSLSFPFIIPCPSLLFTTPFFFSLSSNYPP